MDILNSIRALHNLIRGSVVAACESASLEELSSIAREDEGDTIYAIDRVSEEVIIDFFRREIAVHYPVVLIAEGLDGGRIILPEGTEEPNALWRIIVDPIDGTRGLMYQKRSAWILTGVAPNRGPETNLQDIELAVQGIKEGATNFLLKPWVSTWPSSIVKGPIFKDIILEPH